MIADFLSRRSTPVHKWKLNDFFLRPLFQCWGLPDIDVFTMRENAKCNTFSSRGGSFPGEQSSLHLYFFLLIPLHPRVHWNLLSERLSCTLIMPWWPHQTWFLILFRLSNGAYHHFLQEPGLTSPGGAGDLPIRCAMSSTNSLEDI